MISTDYHHVYGSNDLCVLSCEKYFIKSNSQTRFLPGGGGGDRSEKVRWGKGSGRSLKKNEGSGGRGWSER